MKTISSADPSVKAKKKGYKKYVVTGVIIVLAIVFFVARRGGGASSVLQSAPVAMGNVVETVSVTGQVLPVDKADLSFEKSGVVKAIDVGVGDSVKKGDPIASLDSATDQATLASQQAKLDDMTRGLRPVESAADQSQVASAQTALTNAELDAANASRQAYVAAQGAVSNYADTFFTNPQSANPVLNIITQSQQSQISVNEERLQVSGSLAAWKADLDAQAAATSSASSTDILARAAGYLNTIKNFMSDLSVIVNGLSPGNSSISQNVINADVAAMNSAMGGLNGAITTVTGAQTELSNASSSLDAAQSQFALDNAGSSADAIAAQQAQVALAQAELDQDTITSPLDGTVTAVTPDIGEFVPAGQVEFSVINIGMYKIEAYVAEADIAKVAIGNSAAVTLDAYGPDVNFPAHVTAIDPAETVLSGVPTYKVTLLFDQNDPRIRSGMTANTDILTHQADNVLEIPYRAVITGTSDANGAIVSSTTIRVLRADGKTYDTVPVVTGLKGSDGTVQIISGLTVGQTVVVDLKQ